MAILLPIMMMNINDVSPSDYALASYDLMAKTLGEAAKKAVEHNPSTNKPKNKEDEEAKKVDLSSYEGLYGRDDMPFRIQIAATEKELLVGDLFRKDINESIERLKHTKDHTFKVINKDDFKGETVVFEFDKKGSPSKMWRHSNYFLKM